MVDLRKMRTIINKLPKQLRHIDDEFASATSISPVLSGMPTGKGGVSSRVENGVLGLIEAKNAYAETLSELDEMRRELSPYIDQLEDVRERVVMRLRYIEGKSVYDDDFVKIALMCERSSYNYLTSAEKKIEKMVSGERFA